MKKYMIFTLLLSMNQELLHAEGWTFIEGLIAGMCLSAVVQELISVPKQNNDTNNNDTHNNEQSKEATSDRHACCDHRIHSQAQVLSCGHAYICPVCQLEHDNCKRKQTDSWKNKRVPLKSLRK